MKKTLILVTLLFTFSFSSLSRADGYFEGLWRTFSDAFDTTGLVILGVGTGATLVAFSQDQAMHDTWVNNQRMGKDVSGFGNFWGTGIPEATIAAGQLFLDKKKGIAHSQSLIVSTVVVYAMKYSTQRARPDSDTKTSFPSGHTQVSFVTATHVAVAYGVLPSIPLYTAAVITGLSRLADNAHWFSDVIAGAAIGTLFGRASMLEKGFFVSPMGFGSDDHGYGLELTYLF